MKIAILVEGIGNISVGINSPALLNCIGLHAGYPLDELMDSPHHQVFLNNWPVRLLPGKGWTHLKDGDTVAIRYKFKQGAPP